MWSSSLSRSSSVQDLPLDRDIQGRRRLVGDQQLRLADEGHGDNDPLPEPARQLMGVGLEALRRLRHTYQIGCTLDGPGCRASF